MRWLVGWSGARNATGLGELAPVGGRLLWPGPDPLWAVGDWRADEIRLVSVPLRGVGAAPPGQGSAPGAGSPLGSGSPLGTETAAAPAAEPSGRPGLGERRPARRPARLAVLGRCGATDEQLRRGLQAAYGGAVRHLTAWPGSYTAVLSIGPRTVVLGDLAGVCPVYSTEWCGGTAYAGAALPLADLVGAKPDPLRLALRLACPDWAESGELGEGSVFAGVRRVPAGHALTITSGRPLVAAYEPAPATVGGPVESSEASATAEVTRTLVEAVRCRVRGPHPEAPEGRPPISTDLTGGSASTTVTLLAARVPPRRVGAAAAPAPGGSGGDRARAFDPGEEPPHGGPARGRLGGHPGARVPEQAARVPEGERRGAAGGGSTGAVAGAGAGAGAAAPSRGRPRRVSALDVLFGAQSAAPQVNPDGGQPESHTRPLGSPGYVADGDGDGEPPRSGAVRGSWARPGAATRGQLGAAAAPGGEARASAAGAPSGPPPAASTPGTATGPAAPPGTSPAVVALTSTDGRAAVDERPSATREAELRRAHALAAAEPRLEHLIVAGGADALPYADLLGDPLEGPLTDEPGPGLVSLARLRTRLAAAGTDHLTGHGARQVLDGHPARLADLLLDRRARHVVRPVAAVALTDGRPSASLAVLRAARRLARTGCADGLTDAATRLLALRTGAPHVGSPGWAGGRHPAEEPGTHPRPHPFGPGGESGPDAGGGDPGPGDPGPGDSAPLARSRGRRTGPGDASVDALAWCVPGPAAAWLTDDALSAVAVQLRLAARRPAPDERPGAHRARLALHRHAAEFRVLAQAAEAAGDHAGRGGLRLHAPFLDNQVVRAARRLPAAARMRPGARHDVLRTVLAGAGATGLPADWGAGAPPDPYAAPESERAGLRRAERALRELLASSVLAKAGLVDARALRRSLREAAEGAPVPLDGLADVIAAEVWLRRYHARRGSCWTGMPPAARHALASSAAPGQGRDGRGSAPATAPRGPASADRGSTA